MPAVTSRWGYVAGTNPCRANPKSATCLKMAGRWREEEAAERLGKPVSGTVAGGMGPAGATPAQGSNPRTTGSLDRATGEPWTPFSQSAAGASNPRRGARRSRGLGRGQRETPCRRAEPQERIVHGVASVDKGDERNTGWVARSAGAKTGPGAGNPMGLLLPRLTRL